MLVDLRINAFKGLHVLHVQIILVIREIRGEILRELINELTNKIWWDEKKYVSLQIETNKRYSNVEY